MKDPLLAAMDAHLAARTVKQPITALQKARRIIKLYKAQAKVNQKIGKLHAQAERIAEELAYYENDWR